MVRRKIMGLFVCTLILGMASFAFALVPDLQESTATTAYHAGGGVDVVSVMIAPNGLGKLFTEAYDAAGATVDATVTLYLRNTAGDAIVGFPAEDMWLASTGMNPCVGGSNADDPTDEFGMTTWVDSPVGGGSSTVSLTQVIISGDALTSSGGMGITFNSPDISGDGIVNLTDVGNFAAALGVFSSTSVATYGADLVRDNVINLSDVGRLAPAVGSSCP